MNISVDDLREKCESLLAGKGFSDDDSCVIADHYLFGELSGKRSHGISSFLMFLEKASPAQKKWDVEKDCGSHVLIDGNRNAGHLVSEEAISLAASRAVDHGIAIIGMRNMTSFPIPGYCAWKMARKGVLGLVINNAPASVAAPDGKDPLLGTNPIGFAAPGTDFMLDMATATRARGEVRLHQELGKDLPEGIAIDKDGNPTTDIDEYHAQTPLGGYKGFGIALMIEILSGALLGTKVGTDIQTSLDRGYVFIGIDPTVFSHEYPARIERLMKILDGTRVPGERSLTQYRKRLDEGSVELPDEIARKLGL